MPSPTLREGVESGKRTLVEEILNNTNISQQRCANTGYHDYSHVATRPTLSIGQKYLLTVIQECNARCR